MTKDLKQLLGEGDPVAREAGLSDADVRAMRQAVVVEARRRPVPAPLLWWPRPVTLAAALAVCLALGVSIGLRFSNEISTVPSPRVVTPSRDVRRQLQMTSPGGTRIIWTFHQELEL